MKKKSFVWLFLFPPYGIYLLYKQKTISKLATAIIAVIIAFIMVITIDTVVNPYGAHNEIAEESIQKFNIENENKLGDIRFIEREEPVNAGGITYNKYSVITKKGRYFVYLFLNGKQFDICGIYKVEPEREPVYGEDKMPQYVSNVFPEIRSFLEENKSNYGEYKSLISNMDNETQKVETTNGTYKIETKYQQVVKVFKLGANGEGELIYKSEPVIKLNPKIEKGIKKYNSIGELKRVQSFEFYQDKISQIVEASNGIFKFELYDDGTIRVFKGEVN